MKKTIKILMLFTFIVLTCKVKAYTAYSVGDIVPYNDMNFYVIKASGAK